MAGGVLLIHDDVVEIAVIRRLLAGRGHPMILATSVADAMIAFGHYAPHLVVLAPSVEGGRGDLALRELSSHPNAHGTRVLLLGDGVVGSNAPVAPFPLDGTAFLETVSRLIDDAEKLRAQPPPGVDSASAAPAPDWWHPTAPAREKAPDPPPPSRAYPPGGANAPPASVAAPPPLPPQPPAVAQPALRLTAVTEAPRIGNAPSTGRAAQEPLARMMADLCASRASCRLELKAAEAHRVLWLRDGSLHCATSSVYQESLPFRARADGLIDRQQEAELRAMRRASPSELLGALRSRGYLREIEVVPLVQRWTEQIAIEALAEAESSFRVSPPQLPKNALLAAVE